MVANNSIFSDIEKIKEGMSDKVSLAIQWIASFLAGFTIAFYYEWRLSLVIMATAPLIAVSAFAFSKVGAMIIHIGDIRCKYFLSVYRSVIRIVV